jgi:hypothetical protein
LQQKLNHITVDLGQWLTEWMTRNGPVSSDILEWALSGIGSDSNRPGIHAFQGPDVYGLNIVGATHPDQRFLKSIGTGSNTSANLTTFEIMQDVAFYIITLIWIDRLRKNVNGAAEGPDSIDFYNTPFYTNCRCYFDSPGPSRRCQVFPEASDHLSAALSWNVNAMRFSESPVAPFGLSSLQKRLHSSGTWSQPDTDPVNPSNTSHTPHTHDEHQGNVLLPGDVRFAGQLRILKTLISFGTQSRTYVLGTLAAMGLTHCVHDVRPLEGNEKIAETIRETMASSGLQGAADLLLNNHS